MDMYGQGFLIHDVIQEAVEAAEKNRTTDLLNEIHTYAQAGSLGLSDARQMTLQIMGLIEAYYSE